LIEKLEDQFGDHPQLCPASRALKLCQCPSADVLALRRGENVSMAIPLRLRSTAFPTQTQATGGMGMFFPLPCLKLHPPQRCFPWKVLFDRSRQVRKILLWKAPGKSAA